MVEEGRDPFMDDLAPRGHVADRLFCLRRLALDEPYLLTEVSALCAYQLG